MKFGKKFRAYLQRTLPEWRDKYLCYKLLKKLLNSISAADEGADDAALFPPPELQVCFVAILYLELEKFNDFYVDKEEDFIIRFQALKERIKQVLERGSHDGAFTFETELSEDLIEIRRDFVTIHGEMILLKSYSSLNFAGLIKILKKYDKRTGAWLSLPFIRLAFHQPFFMTGALSRLVHECEANLEALFPVIAEVVEVTTVAAEHTGPTNASLETTLAVGEENVDIYQSSRAAINVIRNLREESSTDNPLSMLYLFGSADNDDTGVVMAENSPSHSS